MLLNSEPFVQTLSRWNHRTGTWTAMTGETYYEAGIAYPAREGVRRAADLPIIGSGTTTTRAVKQSFGDGRDLGGRELTVAVLVEGREAGRHGGVGRSGGNPELGGDFGETERTSASVSTLPIRLAAMSLLDGRG